MINSKQLKALPRRLVLEENNKSRQLLNKIAYVVKKYLYYPVDSFINRTYERVSRSIAFAIRGYMHYDFESAYIYDLMAFKMKRIHETLKNGHAVQQKVDMDALKEAIQICERLFEGNYDDKYHSVHNKKWGRLRSKHIPEYDDQGKIKHYRWETSRRKVKTAAQKKKERAEFLQTWHDGERDRKADLDRLNEILKIHEPHWWD